MEFDRYKHQSQQEIQLLKVNVYWITNYSIHIYILEMLRSQRDYRYIILLFPT